MAVVMTSFEDEPVLVFIVNSNIGQISNSVAFQMPFALHVGIAEMAVGM